jgi:acyl-CoA thioesterase-2
MYGLPRSDYPSGTLENLLGVLDLTQDGPDLFHGTSPDPTAFRVFGGQVAAQSVVAAGRTVGPRRRLAAIQGSFLRQGDPTVPIEYAVTRPAEGRSFSFRHVEARQKGRTIFAASLTFHLGDDGPAHESAADLPDPLGLPEFKPELASLQSGAWEMRRVVEPLSVEGWTIVQSMRTAGPLPEDPALHDALAVYSSDEFILDAAVFVHEPKTENFQRFRIASIDHAMYIHRPPKMDDWFFYRLQSPIAAGGRTFVRAEMRTPDGALFATVVQQGLFQYPPATNGHVS